MKNTVWFALGGAVIGSVIAGFIIAEIPFVSIGICIGVLLGAFAQKEGN